MFKMDVNVTNILSIKFLKNNAFYALQEPKNTKDN